MCKIKQLARKITTFIRIFFKNQTKSCICLQKNAELLQNVFLDFEQFARVYK